MKFKSSTTFFFFLLSGVITGCQQPAASSFSKSAEAALSTFEIPKGFKIELVAAEPLISDPVDMTIDDEGRMYVVEMHGYPLDLNHTGKVILLTDTNGDGRMDKRTVFAGDLTMPTGVMCWKEGILVTDAPNVYYFEDSTGDGIADIKKVILTGFALTNPQYLVNKPVYGLDNWIYLAHEGVEETKVYEKEFGDTGTDIFYPDKPHGRRLPGNANGRNVRFKPGSYMLEETSGSSQFGQTFDAWGHHFLVSNANHIYEEVIANQYLKRNREQPVGNATEALSDHGEACEVYPITQNPENQLLTDVGVITSACGITYYLGGAFPSAYNHDVTFVCEPVSNLVHADRIKGKGASFEASRVLEEREFLASTDSWFRPVNLYTGPDGALYVVDYHREIIEHPEWMSEEAIKSGKLYNGIDKGRIYRVSASETHSVPLSGLNLKEASNEELVQKLADPNIWWRQNAQRLLVDRNQQQAVPALERMVQNPSSPLGCLHALWTLEGMHRLESKWIEQAMKNPVPGIRENAIMLSELHLEDTPSLIHALIAMKDDPDPKVRYQLLCTLGFLNTPLVNTIRQALLIKDVDDKWVQIAALSASSSQSVPMLESLLPAFDPGIPAFGSLVQRLGTMIGSSQPVTAIRGLLQRSLKPTSENINGWQAPLMQGIAEGLTMRKEVLPALRGDQALLISACLQHEEVNVRRSARQMLQVTGLHGGKSVQTMLQRTKNIAGNDTISAAKRAEAINLMSLQNSPQHASFFEHLIRPDVPIVIQLAAIKALNHLGDTIISSFIINHWPEITPGAREEALNTFTTEPFDSQRIRMLFRAIEKGTIHYADIGWPRAVILMRDLPDFLKEQARTLLANKEEERASVLRRYGVALRLKGDPEKGKLVYQANCLICHQVRGKMGVTFGPDLGTLHNWTAESIMINILDPDLSIAHGYSLWNVLLRDGTSIRGIIASETPNAIILHQAAGVETALSRQDIKAMKKLMTSAMPIAFEKKIDQQQMADILAFIKRNE